MGELFSKVTTVFHINVDDMCANVEARRWDDTGAWSVTLLDGEGEL